MTISKVNSNFDIKFTHASTWMSKQRIKISTALANLCQKIRRSTRNFFTLFSQCGSFFKRSNQEINLDNRLNFPTLTRSAHTAKLASNAITYLEANSITNSRGKEIVDPIVI